MSQREPPVRPASASGSALSRDDEQNLKLLSVLFYVYAGIVMFSALLFGAFAVIGLALIPLAGKAPHPGPPPELIGGVLLVVFGLVALFFVGQSIVMVLAGRAFGRRSGYTICVVGACLALMHIPLGTALGVFALVTLMKQPVRDLLARPRR